MGSKAMGSKCQVRQLSVGAKSCELVGSMVYLHGTCGHGQADTLTHVGQLWAVISCRQWMQSDIGQLCGSYSEVTTGLLLCKMLVGASTARRLGLSTATCIYMLLKG